MPVDAHWGALAALTLMAAPARALEQPDALPSSLPSPDGSYRQGWSVEPFVGLPDIDGSLGYGISVVDDVLLVPLVGVTADWSPAAVDSYAHTGSGTVPALPHLGLAVQLWNVVIGYKLVVDVDEPSASQHMFYLAIPF